MTRYSGRFFNQLAGLALLASALLTSLSVQAQAWPDFPFVKSHGEASIQVVPDKAALHLALRSEGPSSEQVVADVEAALAKVLAVLSRFGVQQQSIEATDLHKGSRREHPREPGAQAPEIYYVYRNVRVKLDGIEQYGEIFKALAAIDHLSELQGEFDVNDRAALEAKLLQQAGADAERRAQQMAASLGKKIKDVYGIFPDGNFLQGLEGRGGYADMVMREAKMGVEVLVPETITVQQQVHAIFRLR